MVVIYERDARNPKTVHPFEATCSVCGNIILYRLGPGEATQDYVYRQCPVCKQETRHDVPTDLRERAMKYLEDSTPPEVREAAERWFNKSRQNTERMRRKRETDPSYGQVKKTK